VLLIIPLIFISAIPLLSKNRIATKADQALYGEYISPGDLIIDTPTKVKDDEKEIVYYFMAKQWPGLREGGTIWLDGEKLGKIGEIKICNTSKPLTPWHIKAVRIKNIPYTKVIARSFMCQGPKHLEVNGESEGFPGLSEWPSSRKFITGTFGFHIINKMFGGHGFHLTVLDEGSIKLKGFEAQHGFSGVRISGGDYDITVAEIEITNFYIHDTGDGEGMYLGATHGPPYAKIRNLKIYNGIITRTAAEALQMQHLAGGADVHHVTIRSANVRWTNAFQPNQDTGIQWNLEEGSNRLHDMVVDGFASVGLVPFGNALAKAGGESHVSNIIFNNGIDTGIYLHKSGSHGIEWNFQNIFYRGFNSGCYYEGTGRPERKYIISARNGTDRYSFKNLIHDGSKQRIFQDTVKKKVNYESVSYEDMPAPHYENSGFYESANKVKQWYQYYGSYFPASKGGKMKIPTDWQSGDIAIETKGKYSFYKCVIAHTSTDQRPGESSYFAKLTWDDQGIRSDQETWNSKSKQSDFPPDDLRLKSGSYWEVKGFGFPERLKLSSSK
jgi:hypothetical protein